MREYHDGLAQGRTPITPRVIHVDGTDVEFEAVNLGRYAAAWTSVNSVMNHIWSRGVALDGLSLVSDSEAQRT